MTGVHLLPYGNALRSYAHHDRGGYQWPGAAERMKAMRERRRSRGLHELRLVVPDARSEAVRNRIAAQVARLNPDRERDALLWIEAVSEFDVDEPR